MAQELSATRVGLLDQFTRPQIALIQKTVAKDCNETEFDLFMMMAANLRLNPLKRQIYAIVFNKDKADKRKMTVVTGIDGYRSIAERTNEYRPDEGLPIYEYDESLKGKTNPAGLVSATVKVYKYKRDGWYPVQHQVFWDAYAPLIPGGKLVETGETWPNGNPKKIFEPDGTFTLDPSKQRWHVDPRGMLAKCAEAGALRKGWPDNLSGVYGEEEMDKARSQADIDLLPSEYAEQQRVDDRLQVIQGKDTILMVFPPEALTPTPIGKIFDMAMAYFQDQKFDPDAIEYFRDQNTHGLREYWARAAGDCLALKKRMEELIAEGRKKQAAAKAQEQQKETTS